MCLLAKSLEGYMATHQIILVLDVAKCHFHTSISALAATKGIRLLYVPAKLTFLLQPADTHCFSRLKDRLRKKWVALRAQSSTGTISHKDWLCAVIGIVSTLFNGTKWAPAFQAVGLISEARLSPRIMGQLEWQAPKIIPNMLPSDDQLKLVFPRRSRFSRTSLFSWSVPKPKAKAKAKAKALGKAKAKAMAMVAHAAPMLD